MPIATRTANIVQRNAERRVGVAALHGKIEIDDGVASFLLPTHLAISRSHVLALHRQTSSIVPN
jgi:hypothetical protein